MFIKNKTNSSWWLGNDFFKGDEDILTGEVVTDRTAELIKLAGYRRAISNFVNIVTGKSDIPVRFEGRDCLLYTSPSPRDGLLSRMPSSA